MSRSPPKRLAQYSRQHSDYDQRRQGISSWWQDTKLVVNRNMEAGFCCETKAEAVME